MKRSETHNAFAWCTSRVLCDFDMRGDFQVFSYALKCCNNDNEIYKKTSWERWGQILMIWGSITTLRNSEKHDNYAACVGGAKVKRVGL